ncbi:MAG: hypothetical protein NTZ38_03145 [Candidatus Taylorbacteria bacterium]|nr:hypothetical protein [Candidatus Taylorbacteria bacterium]
MDIQSSIVRSSLVLLKQGSIPHIFSMNEWAVPYRHNSGSAQLIESTLKLISEAVTTGGRILHEKHSEKGSILPKHISEIHFVLSSPWIISMARTITERFSKPMTATKRLVSDIIARERARDISHDDSNIEMIEEKIFDVRLNGYSVSRWEDKITDKLDISFATSVAGSDTMNYLRAICSHIIPAKRIHLHSSLLLQYIGIFSILPDQKDYILIHIHGELTDVVIVEHGTCLFFGSFPKGINNILHAVAVATHSTAKIADSLLTLCVNDHLDWEQARNAKIIIDKMIEGWIDSLKELFSRSTCAEALPKTVMISCRVHEDLFIKDFQTAFPKICVKSFTSEQLSSLVSFAGHIEILRLTGLYAIAMNNMSA